MNVIESEPETHLYYPGCNPVPGGGDTPLYKFLSNFGSARIMTFRNPYPIHLFEP